MAMTSTLPPPTLYAGAVASFGRWEAALNDDFVERETEIHLFALALAAKEHMVLFGEPGIAKTNIIERGMLYIIGGKVFILGVGALSTQDDTDGPVSLAGLEQDERRRVVDNYAPGAHVVVYDEGFRMGISLSDMQLRLMNERTYKDNGVEKKAPLVTMVLTSNSERQSDEQEAFDDRLLIRKVVDRVRDRANVIRMLRLVHDPHPTPVMQWAELEAIHAAVPGMPIADEVYEMVADLERDLLNAGVAVTPRRLRKCMPLLQADALLEGADRVETDHVAVLEHCAWLRIADQPKAQQLVLKAAAPAAEEALHLLADIQETAIVVNTLLDEATKKGEAADYDKASVAQKEIVQLNEKLARCAATAGSSKRVRTVLDRCYSLKNATAMRLLVDAFGVTPANVQGMLDQGKV